MTKQKKEIGYTLLKVAGQRLKEVIEEHACFKIGLV